MASPIVYLDLNTWISGKLKGDASLVTLLGTADKVIYNYIQTIAGILPVVTYLVESQMDTVTGYFDNVQQYIDAVVQIGVWTNWTYGHLPICQAVDRIMKANGFSLINSGDVPDQTPAVRHEVIRYRCEGIAASDLV